MAQKRNNVEDLCGFQIWWDEQKVWTDTGDDYMDYNISFDDFIKLAKYIEKGKQQ
jgi:hypothetical protein